MIKVLYYLGITLLLFSIFRAEYEASVARAVTPTTASRTPSQPTMVQRRPTSGPSTIPPMLPTPLMKLVTAPPLAPPMFMLTLPARMESGPQMAAPVTIRQTQLTRTP